MKLLIFFIISIVQVSHAIYPTGCKKKGYSCFNDENMDDKYYECTEVYEGIRTCPRGTKCVQKERDEEVIPCETVKAKPFSLLKQKIWSKRSSHLKTAQLPPDFNVTECTISGLFCIMDGEHDYQYYECSDTYQGYRDCAEATICAGEEGNPYDYNPCVNGPNATIVSSSGTTTSETSSGTTSSGIPSTPSVGTSSSSGLPPDYNVTECKVNGLFCVMDGEHDYQYYECSDTYQGYRDCAEATKCAGEEGNPYDYNPCVNDPNAPAVSSSGTSSDSNSTTSSGTPSTPSVGTSSSSGLPPDYNVTECTISGLFCIMDGEHDYQYYECSDTYQGFRDCAVGTKCAGEEGNPYDYNPCINDPNAPAVSSGTTSSETSSGAPSTPSVGSTSSSGGLPPDYNVTECTISGLFCVMDGEHDYQYYECSDTYQGYRDCAVGTKCAGDKGNPYDYNPCVNDPNAPAVSSGTTSSETSSGTPTTPSVGTSSSGSLPPDYNVTECKVNGLFCVMDGNHDYQYYECSDTYQGYRDCAAGTKCAGEEGNPYDYNPCINDPNAPAVSSSGTTTSETSSETSSGTPTTPSVGSTSSSTSSDSNSTTSSESSSGTSSSSFSSSGGLPPDYNVTECKVNGLFCIIDGEHDYQYYECSDTFKGFRDCATGTKCAGEQNNPYDYNPCINDPNAPVVSSSGTSSESSSEKQSSQTESSSGTPSTPSVGASSSSFSSSSSGLPQDYNVTECKVNGLFCIMDGNHDYQYYECSDTFKGFRDCAPGTKCAGEQDAPYDYNPCINDPNAPVASSETKSSSEPTTSESSFSDNSTETTSSSAVSSDSNSTTSETSSGTPSTPSVGSTSSSGLPPDYNVTECTISGLFCVMDGDHDYQYYECSDTFKGFRDCAPGTKCAGEQNNPYDYNPCINDPNAPVVSSSEKQSSSEPIKSSDSNTTSSETPSESSDSNSTTSSSVVSSDSNSTTSETSPESSSGTPTTPSVGTSSSSSLSSSGLPPDYNVTECKVNGLFCVMDGNHDYQYYECSDRFKGFRDCAPGTKCAGEQDAPYKYNPCIIDPNAPIPTQSSSEPTTPSVGTSSSGSLPPDYNVTECKIEGLFCVMDGKHDYQYYECSDSYGGFRNCAPGTKCGGEEGNPYNYNPCVNDPNAPIQTQSSSEKNPSETTESSTESSSEKPVTPSVGASSSSSGLPPDYNVTECKIEGLFCIMDGNHDYQYYECSETYKGYRDCAPGTKCAGKEGNPYDYNPCVVISETDSSTSEKPATSSGTPVTPSVGVSSEEDDGTCGSFVCPSFGIFCYIDGKHNNKYCECSQTFNGSRPCAPGTWCRGPQDTPYEYNPCVFIDQTTWFGNETKTL